MLKNFKNLNIYLKIIFIFCALGFLYNIYYLWKFRALGFYARVFLGFGALFLAQMVLIYLRDARVVMFSAMQCFFAFFASGEFTFIWVVRPVLFVLKAAMAFTGINAFYKAAYIAFALLFTLELLKTKLLYDFLKK